MKLRDIGKLDLLYTMDGKTYLTPEQLARDIKDELFVNNGRWKLRLGPLNELEDIDASQLCSLSFSLSYAEVCFDATLMTARHLKAGST